MNIWAAYIESWVEVTDGDAKRVGGYTGVSVSCLATLICTVCTVTTAKPFLGLLLLCTYTVHTVGSPHHFI